MITSGWGHQALAVPASADLLQEGIDSSQWELRQAQIAYASFHESVVNSEVLTGSDKNFSETMALQEIFTTAE